MIHFLVQLPIWTLIRVFGLLSYFTLFIGMALGIACGFPKWKERKARLLKWHTAANQTGTVLALLHGLLLIIDTYMPFDWHEILIPFASAHSTVLNALGTLAMYGLLVVMFTTDLRNKLKRKIWLAFHLLSYPIFVLALIHGLFLGTDSSQPLVKVMYIATAAALVILTIVRIAIKPRKGRIQVVYVKNM